MPAEDNPPTVPRSRQCTGYSDRNPDADTESLEHQRKANLTVYIRPALLPDQLEFSLPGEHECYPRASSEVQCESSTVPWR